MPNSKSPRNRRPIIEPLEPRLLFSATADIAVLDDANSDTAYLIDAAANTNLDLVYNQQENLLDVTGFVQEETVAATGSNPSVNPKELVFIDTRVENYQALLDDILQNDQRDDIAVVLLKEDQQGIAQITASLAGYSGLTAIHLISHGTSGAIQLGNSLITADGVDHYRNELLSWRDSLGADADILIYGCNLAGNDAGMQLMTRLAELTQADIAASDDLTGHHQQGGDWDLEVSTGVVETRTIFSANVQENWQGLLVDVNHIHVTAGANSLAFSSSVNVGQSFIYDSTDPTYTVNQLSIQLRKDASAAEQTITVQLLDAWSGTVLGADTKSSNSLSTSFAWKTFDFSDVQLNDNQTYYIRISSDSNDGLVMVSYHQADLYNNATLIENGTPNTNSWDLAFKVTDDDGTNATPAIANPIPNQTATEQVHFSYTFPADTFNDADVNDTLTYSARIAGGGNLPPWLNFDAPTRTFWGMPDNGDVGVITVEVIATDDHDASVFDSFDLTIVNVNDDPFVANPIANQAATEDVAFNFTFPANAFGEVDAGDTLTYTAQLAGGGALPAWLNFDSATRTFSGTPTAGDVGTIAIEVTADDGHGGIPATDTFDIVIYDASFVANTIYQTSGASLDTTILSPGQGLYQTFFHASGNGTYTIDYLAIQLRKDPSAQLQTITVSLSETFDGVVLAQGTLSSSDLENTLTWETFDFSNLTLTDGQVYFIKIETSGSDGLISMGVHNTDVYPNGTLYYDSGTPDASRDIAFQIASGINNHPIVNNPIPNQTATEDAAFNFQFAANTFTDIDGDALTYSAQLAGGGALPAWLSFNASTRTFSGTPINAHVGTISIEVIANDGQGGTVSDTFDIVVQNTNDNPTVVNPITDQSATEDVPFNFTFPVNTFNDVDVGDTLTYSAQMSGGGALPAWLSFDAATRSFSGTPLNADVGVVAIDVTAADGNGGTVADTFTITVVNINDVPTVANIIPDQHATEDSAFNFQFAANTFTDMDGDALTYSAQLAGGGALPAWLSFDANTRTFSGTPTDSDVGAIAIDVIASDGNGGTATATFELVVITTGDTHYIEVGSGNRLLTVSAANHLGQSFRYDSPVATYNVNEISVELARYASAASQTITVELRDAWSGAVLGSDSISSDAISATGFEWHSFRFANLALNDNQSYVIRISSTGTDDGILVRHHDADQFANGALIENGTPHPSGWDLAFKVSQEDGNNLAPVVDNPLPDQTAYEDTPFNFVVPPNTFSDTDPNDTLTYRAQLAGGGSLGWLTFNEITQTFSGTPHNAHIGSFTVEIIATDNHGASVSEFFELTVINVNDDPFVRFPLADQAVTEDNAFNFTVPADAFGDDDAGAVLTYSAQLAGGGALPSWLVFDAATRTFNGTPAAADVGTLSIEVIADDGQGGTPASDHFDIVVYAATAPADIIYESSPPALNGTGLADGQDAYQSFLELGGNGTYVVDNVSVQLRRNPDADQTPQMITLSIMDGFNGTVLASNTLSSTELGTSLAWYSFDVSNLALTYGQTYFIKVSATGNNADPLVYAGIHDTNVYNGGQYYNNNGVADPNRDLAFEVSGINNTPVVANPIADQLATQNSTFSFTFAANTFIDADGDVLIYTAQLSGGGALPAWLNFDANTRTFSGTPGNDDVGTMTIEVTASDGNGGTAATDIFSILVVDVNDAPVLAIPIPDQFATEDSAFTYTIPAATFTDVDAGDTLEYSAQLVGGGSLPTWLSFDANTRTFSGMATHLDTGTLSIEILVSDGNGGVASDTFELLVARVNSAPTTSGFADITRDAGDGSDTLDLFAAFADEEDADNQLTFTLVENTNTALFSDMAINPVTGTLQLTYAAGQAGSSVITLRATDSDGGSVETSFTVTLVPINAAPVSSGLSDVAATSETPPASINLKEFFTDAEDGAELLYSVAGNSNPALAQLVALDTDDGTLTLHFSADTLGETTITIRATDSQGAWVETSFHVSVQAPVVNPPIDPPIETPIDPPVETPVEIPTESPVEMPGQEPPVVTPEKPPVDSTPINNNPPPTDNDAPITAPPDSNMGVEEPVAPGEENTDILVNNASSAPVLVAPAEFADGYDDDDRNRPQWTDERREFTEQMRQQANPYSTLASLIAPESGYLAAQEMIDFNQQVDRARADMAKVLEEDQQQQAMIAGITLSVTTGILIWSLRASSLFLTLFSMLPLWKGIDPLPILDEVNKRKKNLEQQRKDKAKEDRNANEVGYLFDNINRRSK